MRPFQILQTCLQNCQVRHREVELAEVGKIPLAVSARIRASVPWRASLSVPCRIGRVPARVNDLLDVIDYLREVLREVYNYGVIISHIFCTFASQSRAFLSQLSVTGDESGFFYVLPQRYYNSHSILTFPLSFLFPVSQRTLYILFRFLFICPIL